MTFYSDAQPLPQDLCTATFVLKPLTPEYALLDYEAYISSSEVIRVHSGGRWPIADFTLNDEREQLAQHAQRHQARQDFAFIILERTEQRSLGCVYVLPLRPFLQRVNAPAELVKRIGDDAAMITFWVRQSAQDTALPEDLVQATWRWFSSEWSFSQCFFRVSQAEARSRQALESSGLSEQFAICPAGWLFGYLFYGNQP